MSDLKQEIIKILQETMSLSVQLNPMGEPSFDRNGIGLSFPSMVECSDKIIALLEEDGKTHVCGPQGCWKELILDLVDEPPGHTDKCSVCHRNLSVHKLADCDRDDCPLPEMDRPYG